MGIDRGIRDRPEHATMLFRRPQSGSIVFLSASLCPLIFWGDCASGSELTFSIFYLVPISLSAWYSSPLAGVSFSLVGAFLCGYAEFLEYKTYSHTWIGAWNGLVRLIFFLIVAYLVSRVRCEMNRIEGLARIDPLTGSKNRRFLFELLEQELEKLKRYGRPFSLLYFDLDNFKVVNDTLGHEVGDEVLKLVVATLEAALRRVDVLARLGGDEFVVLLPEADASQILLVAERLRAATQQAMLARNWPVTSSIGGITITQVTSVEAIIQAADAGMYAAKKSGKNSFCLGPLLSSEDARSA